MIDVRLRSRISDEELQSKVGKIVTDADYNLLLTGPARVRKPDGSLLCVYVPGALTDVLGAVYPTLHSMKNLLTTNRGLASGTERVRSGEQKRTRSKAIASGVVGAVDPGGQLPFCRLTAWTGEHADEWVELRPVFQAIADHFRALVPERYAAQAAVVARTRPEWVIPDTPFTTITVNNTWPTGVHTDKGDLEEGFSNLAVLRRGSYSGGVFTFPRYRVGVDMHDGDLVLLDAHEWHGNTAIRCEHQEAPLNGPCPAGCERISLVSYYRTKMESCGTPDDELARAQASASARSG